MGSVENYHPFHESERILLEATHFSLNHPSKGSKLKGAFLQLQVAHYEMGRQTS